VGHELKHYRDALAYLFARTTGGNKFGLERTEAFLASLGNPHQQVRTFHVAGTNGKGSVCATLEALLRARGLTVGKYTSPHLVDFRERFLIDGKPVDESYVVDFIRRWTPEVERIGATFFEATTAMAFDLFATRGVDVAVIETGLGGRLDSTNVVQPLAASVVSIGIDHTEYLGSTREEIAAEKAGIFKRGVPAEVGEPDESIARRLCELAVARGAAPVTWLWRESPPRDVTVDEYGTAFDLALGGESRRLRTPLIGRHQASNTSLAILMLKDAGPRYFASLDDVGEGLEQVRLPGRFHRVERFIFDVAHNPDGTAVLARTLNAVELSRPAVALLCVLGDKDWRGIMRALAGAVDLFVLTDAPTAPESRLWSLREARDFATESGWDVVAEPDFERALVVSQQLGQTVVVTGSFHTVGDAMARLQVDPLAG
jgi:dihydrofolate synthase / folylpolyglutamate synthase